MILGSLKRKSLPFTNQNYFLQLKNRTFNTNNNNSNDNNNNDSNNNPHITQQQQQQQRRPQMNQGLRLSIQLSQHAPRLLHAKSVPENILKAHKRHSAYRLQPPIRYEYTHTHKQTKTQLIQTHKRNHNKQTNNKQKKRPKVRVFNRFSV